MARRVPLLAALLLVAACAGGGTATPTPGINVVTTSTVFADLVRQAGGDEVTATSLVPAGVDVHTYVAKPADLRALAAADLIVMNGLGLDDWLLGTIEASGADAPILKLGEDVPGVELLPGEEAGTRNPHLWMDVSNAKRYVERIAEALGEADPGASVAIDGTSATYLARLDALDTQIRQQIGTIPAANRKLVMFHDAFPYFARAYGLDVVGVAVEAPGQDPSAGEIAALIDAIRASGVKAIFSEDQFPPTLVEQLARETGTKVVADLYDDSLGDEPVTSYEALIHWDVDHIVDALR